MNTYKKIIGFLIKSQITGILRIILLLHMPILLISCDLVSIEHIDTVHSIKKAQFALRPKIIEVGRKEISSYQMVDIKEIAISSLGEQRVGEIRIAWPDNLESRELIKEIIDIMTYHGVGRDDIIVGSYQPEQRNGKDTIVVWYNEITLDDIGCIPDATFNTFGCATSKNIANMLANPEDYYNKSTKY